MMRLCVDWDLEAPGLQHYFRKSSFKFGSPGILEIILEANKKTNIEWKTKIRTIKLSDSKGMDFLAAGKPDKDYVKKLNKLDWDDLYEKKGLGEIFEDIRNELRKVVDGHVMVQTIALKDEYTGERDFSL